MLKIHSLFKMKTNNTTTTSTSVSPSTVAAITAATASSTTRVMKRPIVAIKRMPTRKLNTFKKKQKPFMGFVTWFLDEPVTITLETAVRTFKCKTVPQRIGFADLTPADYAAAVKILQEIHEDLPVEGQYSSFLNMDGASFVKVSERSRLFDSIKRPTSLAALPTSAFRARLSLRILGMKQKGVYTSFMYEVEQLKECKRSGGNREKVVETCHFSSSSEDEEDEEEEETGSVQVSEDDSE